ncbi:serine/threonine-protein kinase [Rhizobacter fulvus]
MNRTPVADWQQLSALYKLAAALDADSLEDWLLRLEAQAHPLLPQLQQMLDDRARTPYSDLFEDLPSPRSPRPARREETRDAARREGGRFGPYRLQRRMADGDAAEVWLAQRDDAAASAREVITLLSRQAGAVERDTFTRRFERERDMLAALNHPNIAGLHGAGVTASGRPWIAREFVDGEPLMAWCNGRRLGIRARVLLFRQVVLAVRHAHAHLVLHRDLNPDNLLVTRQGEVRVLDFGLVQLLEPDGVASVETEMTRLAGNPVLPWYAAPEQLLGQSLTTACDVYALGVILYELLCGHRPDEPTIESAAVLEQSILDIVPRPPSERRLGPEIARQRGSTPARLRHALAGDLDAIVLKTLAKQPSQRCVSAEALRAELDRWLAGVPVESRAIGRWGRAGRFLQRQVERIAAL